MADTGRVAKLELALQLAVQRSVTIDSEAFLNSFPSDIVTNQRDFLLNLHSSIPRTLQTAILVRTEVRPLPLLIRKVGGRADREGNGPSGEAHRTRRSGAGAAAVRRQGPESVRRPVPALPA